MAHCDLKPGNLLIANAAAAHLRLSDFQLSKPKSDPIVVGTHASPSFAPPEWYLLQSSDEARVVGTSYEKFDIWAVGVIFYMTLCNAHPLPFAPSKVEMKHIMEDLFQKESNDQVWIHLPSSLPEEAKVGQELFVGNSPCEYNYIYCIYIHTYIDSLDQSYI
jgi:serine/threonine protein kinase